jgi:[ribosomal protein S5]-alanine N-acetyltransferase
LDTITREELKAILKDLPSLETERLLLRQLEMRDAEDMFEYALDRELAIMGLWLPFDKLEDSYDDLKETLEQYDQANIMDWAIELKSEQKMIGRLGLRPYSYVNRRAELGYALNRKYWGKGYTTEAVKAVLNFGFETIKMNRIEAEVLPDNPASIRVLQKVGMTLEGVKREATFIRKQADDLQWYAVLRSEWGG